MSTDREAWVAIENDFPDHPKLVQVGSLGGWAHLCAICYADRFRTNGFIPETIAWRILHQDGVMDQETDLLHSLLEANLWEQVEGGYRIHDYLRHQRNADEIRDLRAIRAEAGRRGGIASGAARRSKSEANPSKAEAETEEETEKEPPLTPPKQKTTEVDANDIRNRAFQAYRSHGGNLTLEKERSALAQGVTSLLKAGTSPDLIIYAAGDLGRTQAFPGYLKRRAKEITENGGICRNRGLTRSKLTIAELRQCGCERCADWAITLEGQAAQ